VSALVLPLTPASRHRSRLFIRPWIAGALLIPLAGLSQTQGLQAAPLTEGHFEAQETQGTAHLFSVKQIQAVALGEEGEKSRTGHPEIHLDSLKFPKNIHGSAGLEKHLKRALQREAYRADWGAGRDNRIEYRFEVSKLSYAIDDGALRIQCEAVGSLPGRRSAKSRLSFGGRPAERIALTKQVLAIVARGVVTRLAELERKRRGLR